MIITLQIYWNKHKELMDKTKHIREQLVTNIIKDQIKKIDPKNLSRSRYLEGSLQISHSLKELLKNKKHLFNNWNFFNNINNESNADINNEFRETARFDTELQNKITDKFIDRKTNEFSFDLAPENTIFSTSHILASARIKHEERRKKNHSPSPELFSQNYYVTHTGLSSRIINIDNSSISRNYYRKLKNLLLKNPKIQW